MRRRDFLRHAAALAGTAVVGGSLWQEALAAFPAQAGPGPYGPLLPPDANGLRLPAGFVSRELARGGELVAGTAYQWHVYPDGGAVFPCQAGWIYVSNSESLDLPFISSSGASALRFDAAGALVDAYRILGGTLLNCAGGATPWGTWLSCEEHPDGLVWECDPGGGAGALAQPALGRFKHEAAAVDPDFGHVYLTEDQPDGRLYRFTPSRTAALASGLLEVARVQAGQVDWLTVPEPNPPNTTENPTRRQVPESTPFDGGEGIVCAGGRVYFTTKGDNRVWAYTPLTGSLAVIYDDDSDPGVQLTGVDNIAAARSGDLLVAEDKPSQQQHVLLTPDGVTSALVEMDQQGSEFTGPAWDPSGTRLYFSSQRGNSYGITYEVSGPFRSHVHKGC